MWSNGAWWCVQKTPTIDQLCIFSSKGLATICSTWACGVVAVVSNAGKVLSPCFATALLMACFQLSLGAKPMPRMNKHGSKRKPYGKAWKVCVAE
jgi:hypothetical protein